MAATFALGLLAGVYLAAARRTPRWPRRHTACFLGGLAVLALAAGLAGAAAERLSWHMVQHVVLALVAPPLLVLGRPVTLALRVLPAARARGAARLLRSPPLQLLTRPLVASSLFSAVLVASHVPTFYDATLRSEPLHAAEHALYLWTALLLWAAVLRAEPLPGSPSPLTRILALMLVMVPMALVGTALIGWDGVVYDHYATAAAAEAAPDQRIAGWLMWIGGGAVVALATVWAGWSALEREEARQRAREARLDARAGGLS